MRIQPAIGFSAGLLATSSLASYGLGLMRDRLLASQFGASRDLDVYNAAFVIPDLITNLFVAALTTAFIPVLTSVYHKKGEDEGWKLINSLLTLLITVLLIAIVIVWIALPGLVRFVAPGFNATQTLLLVHTTRLLLLSPFCFGLSTVFGSALQSTHRFLSYALSPVLYNMSIIVGIVLLAPRFGIQGVIVGVVVGAFVHMAIRLIELYRTGWRWKLVPRVVQSWRNPALKKTVRLMMPRVVGLLATQANLWVYTAFASGLAVGSITIFNLARNFQSLPVSLFGIALATASFPVLAQHFVRAQIKQFEQQTTRLIKQILFFTLPACVGMILLSRPLIDTVLGTGAFTPSAVAATSMTLSVFALAIPIESILHILARAFYAQHNTITPSIVAVVSSIFNVVFCWFAIRSFGVNGLALAFTITTLTQVVLLFLLLRRRVHFAFADIGLTVAKLCVSCAAMTASIILLKYLIHSSILQLLVGTIVGAIVYLVLTYALKVAEIQAVGTIVKRLIPLKR